MVEKVVSQKTLRGDRLEAMARVGDLERQDADHLFADPLLHGVGHAIRRRWRPDVLDAIDMKPARLMHVAGGDEAKIARGEGGEQPASGHQRDVADVHLGIARAVAEQWLVQHHPEGTLPIAELLLQPDELLVLRIGAGAEQLGVETDDLPGAAFERPPVGAKEAAIVAQALEIQGVVVRRARLDGIVTDVVIAREEARPIGTR